MQGTIGRVAASDTDGQSTADKRVRSELRYYYVINAAEKVL